MEVARAAARVAVARAEATAEAMVEARVAVRTEVRGVTMAAMAVVVGVRVDSEAADMVGPAGMAAMTVVLVDVLGRSLG